MSRRQPRIVAWRSIDELTQLRSDFFTSTATLDRRKQALAKVTAWTVRGRIPHSIEATAMLTETVLYDSPSAPQLNTRLTYSTAICRFVNGLLDPEQQSHFALPMHTLARNLNLPASFVEIRHAATHETLPSLAVLRTFAARALDWLWENYWVSVDSAQQAEDVQEEAKIWRARLALKQWRRLRRENPMKELKEGDPSKENRESLAVVKECLAICKDEDGLETLVDALLEEKALIPVGKKKTNLMRGAILLWTPLLNALHASLPEFTNQLLRSILEVFKLSSDPQLYLPRFNKDTDDIESAQQLASEYNEAALAWMQHLTAVSRNKLAAGKNAENTAIDIEGLAKQCVLDPNEWSTRFLRHLLTEYPSLQKKYSPLVELAETQVLPLPSSKSLKRKRAKNDEEGSSQSLAQIEENIKRFEEQLETMQRQKLDWEATTVTKRHKSTPDDVASNGGRMEVVVSGGKWKKWRGPWVARPLGELVV